MAAMGGKTSGLALKRLVLPVALANSSRDSNGCSPGGSPARIDAVGVLGLEFIARVRALNRTCPLDPASDIIATGVSDHRVQSGHLSFVL
jgi:hypothetical protein